MSVPTNLIPSPITGLQEYTGSSTLGYLPYVLEGRSYKVQFANIAAVGAVPSSRVIAAGTGLAGGGDLTTNRVISIANGGVGFDQLALSGVTQGTYGSGSAIPILTVDAKGRVTSATTASLDVTGFVPTSRTITAGDGLTGGGSLANNISLAANFSAATPSALGTASAGTAITVSRGDHVHPAVNLSDTTQTQGALPLGRGGTGDALSPVAGAVVYSTGTKFALTNPGLSGQVLVSGGTDEPQWQTFEGGGTVTSVNASGGTTGLSFAGGPITISGTLTLGGTLAVASGGTGATTAAAARTNLGATTIGGNVFTLTNPSAITFPRFNADNTVSALDAATFRTAIGAGTGAGSVTSVSGTGTVSGLTLSGTVTTSGSLTLGGTLAVTPSNFSSQTANTFLAAPNGAAGVPTFRAIVAADVPTLNQNTTGTASNVTGIVAVANGGTGASVAATARTNLGAAASGANTDITSIALTTGTISATPTNGTDIVNKVYADSIASGINFHQSVRLATAAALPANTYNNGTGGVGATLTANANGALSVDGVAVAVGNRILVKNEAAGANNGVYTVTQVGSAGTPYILTRATDFDSAGTGVDQIDAGDFFLVTAGSTQSNTSWVQQTPLPITVGTTALVFTQFAAPVLYSAGTGLTLAGTVFSLTAPVTVALGGTGATSLSSGYLVKGNGTSAVSASVVYDNGTNVGIGTASPSGKLQINGNFLRIDQSGSNAAFLGNAADLITGAPAGAGLRFDGTALRIAASSTEIAQFTSGGNFGIGTASPAYRLHVASTSGYVAAFRGTTAANSGILVGNTAGDTAVQTLASGDGFIFSDTGKYLAFGSNGASEKMRITSTGNVGIGTTTPAYKLQVDGTIRANGGDVQAYLGALSTYGVAGTAAVKLFQNSGNWEINNPGGYLQFYNATAAAERMRITDTGNVGIGTSSPAQKLSVAGTIESTSGGVIVPDQLAYDYATSNLPTTRPALSLDFADVGALDPRITFTRASTATFTGSNGLIQTAAINAPRFDYDPVTLAAKGLLIEEQRTNLLTYSNDFTTGWVVQAFGTASLPVVTPAFATSPDGTQNAARLQMTLNGGTTTADYAVLQHGTTTVVSGASYAYSIWLKSNTGSNQVVLARDDGASGSTAVLWTVTPTWQRFSYAATTNATTAIGPKIWIRGALGTSATADILIYGAQLEAGAFATSYIPTVASQVTRSTDVAQMTGTNFSNWYRQDEGTMVFEGSSVGPSTLAQTLNALTVSDGTNNNVHRIGRYLDFWFGETRDGNVQQASPSAAGSYTQNATAKVAYAYKTNDFALSANGAAALTDTSGTVPTVVNLLRIGGPPVELNGHIRSITYYNTRLPNAVLQGITS